MKDVSKMTAEELKSYVATMQQTIEKQAEILKTAKITKEKSDYFRTANSDEKHSYRTLSETKKHLEAKHSKILDVFKKENNDKLMTSNEFHALLVKHINV